MSQRILNPPQSSQALRANGEGDLHTGDKEESSVARGACDDEDNYPDGGTRAWLVVAGAMCNTIATFGYVNAWGAFQGYYEQNTLSSTSPSNIAWIGSIQYSLTFFPALFTGRLFDLGYLKGPLFAASVLLVVSTFLIAQCTKYWHFILCQGFAVGLASGVIFGPTVGVLSHWFKRRRGLALGLMGVGSSTGGVIFPVAFRKLVEQVGFPWTMRILAFVLLAVMVTPNLTLTRRLPPVQASGGLIDTRPFKHPALLLYTLASFICFLGLYTVLTFISSSARRSGLSVDWSVYLVSIANAGTAVGRASGGVVADRVGALTALIPYTLIAGMLTFVWPFVHSQGGLIALALMYGIGSGVFGAILAVPVTHFGGLGDVGRRSGFYLAIVALGALAGPPTSGAINRATDGFAAVGIYAGSCILLAVAMMIWARYLALGGWAGKL